MDRRPTRGERRRARRRQEDDQLVEEGSCVLMSSLVLYPVGSLAAFVVVLTGTRVNPVTLERFGRTKGSTVESMRLAVQDLNGGPVSALQMALVGVVLFVIVPGILWYLRTRRPKAILLAMFWFMHPRSTAAAQRHVALGVLQAIGLIAMQTLGLWPAIALALVWAPPVVAPRRGRADRATA
jgi:hypothetical protein